MMLIVYTDSNAHIKNPSEIDLMDFYVGYLINRKNMTESKPAPYFHKRI